MSPLTDRQLAKRLRPDSVPEPPAGLLDELRRQIPAEVKAPAPAELANVVPFRRPLPRRVWLAAASVVMLLGGGTLSWLAVRNHVGLGSAAEPAPRPRPVDDFESVPGSPAEARTGSAGAMQPRDRDALGYVGVPSAAPPATAPTYPGRSSAPEREAVAFGVAAPRQRVPVPPAEAPARRRADAPESMAAPLPAEGPTGLAGELELDQQAEGARDAAPARAERDREASFEDVITVTAESPRTDERRVSAGATVMSDQLAKIPVAQQRWRIVRSTPGVLAERGGAGVEAAAEVAAGDASPASAATAKTRAASAPLAGVSARNAAAPNVVFENNGADPFVDSEHDRFSVFSFDVGTASYDVVRRHLAGGSLPPPEAVRVEEVVNAFDYGDAAPASADFALTAEGAPDPWAPGDRYVLVRFAVKAREARRGVVEPVVARDARAEVEVDPQYVSRWRLLGYEHRGKTSGRFRDEGADTAAVRAGQSVSALYELELRPDAPATATLAVLRVSWQPTEGSEPRELQQPLRRGGVASTWERAGRGFRLATAVGRLAEVLRGSYWAKGDDLGEIERRLNAVRKEWPQQARVEQLTLLVSRARRATEP